MATTGETLRQERSRLQSRHFMLNCGPISHGDRQELNRIGRRLNEINVLLGRATVTAELIETLHEGVDTAIRRWIEVTEALEDAEPGAMHIDCGDDTISRVRLEREQASLNEKIASDLKFLTDRWYRELLDAMAERVAPKVEQAPALVAAE